MGAVGGPYSLYAVDDEWTAGHSYSPGALVLWNGTVYLARGYVTNSQTSPDADTANFMVYAPTGSVPYTLPTSSDSVLGGIKVGSGLDIDGSGVLSTVAVPAALPPNRACYDSFRRDDGAAWGSMSDGVHAWGVVSAGGTDNTLVNHAGRQHANASFGDGSDVMYTTPALGQDDLEVVLRWSVTNTGDALGIFVRENGAALSVWAKLLLSCGNPDVYFSINGDTDSDPIGLLTGAGGAALGGASGGDTLWTRVRASGLVYSWRTWAELADEPATWDGTHTTTVTCSGRSVGLQGGFSAMGHDLYISSLTVYDLGDL